MTSSADAITSTDVDFIHPDGRRVSGRIWLGLPYTVDEHEARCPCGIDGLDDQLADIGGSDTFQALLLAARLLANRLSDFKEKGGRLFHPGTDEPFELEPYFGTLLRPGAAFVDAEMDWRRPDVTAIVKFDGLASVVPDELDRLVLWLEQQGYTIVKLDGSKGQRELRRQLGVLLRWEEEFGYRLEDGQGSLDALDDGFDFHVPRPGGMVLSVVEPHVAWNEDPHWFEGFLHIAADHSRYHLAEGRRFFTLLALDLDSPFIGKSVGTFSVPYPSKAPRR